MAAVQCLVSVTDYFKQCCVSQCILDPPSPTHLSVGFTSAGSIKVMWQRSLSDNTESFEITLLPDGMTPDSCSEPGCFVNAPLSTACSQGSTTCGVNINSAMLQLGTNYAFYARSVNCRGRSDLVGPEYLQFRSPEG